MTANAYVRARIDQEIKDDATYVHCPGKGAADRIDPTKRETLAAMDAARQIAKTKRERFGSAQGLEAAA